MRIETGNGDWERGIWNAIKYEEWGMQNGNREWEWERGIVTGNGGMGTGNGEQRVGNWE